MLEINYLLIFIAALIAIASPGPATLAISATSLNQGRKYGLALAAGVLTGSLLWSFSAAFGLAVLMSANAWLFEVLRYFGAGYLLYLSYKSLHSALSANQDEMLNSPVSALKSAYLRGLLIHLLNPKAILFFAALYSLGLPTEVSNIELLKVIATVGFTSSAIFIGYAWLFSLPKVRVLYLKSRRIFEAVFAVFFGIASVKVLTGNLNV
ncbi:MAG: putative amino acid efflux protein [Osedax symbiont Rs1]|nr:MAG: putative amino acid efflux protein [Osedax symbiont Rs1]